MTILTNRLPVFRAQKPACPDLSLATPPLADRVGSGRNFKPPFAHALSSYDDSRTLLMATSNVQGVREALLNHQGRLSLAGRSFACPQNAICWRFSPNQKHTQRLERCLLLEVYRRQVRSETFMSFIWRKPARFECLCSSFWSELSLQTQVGEWFLRCITFALDLKVCP